MSRPQLSAVLELLKPITWFPPMWAFACGVGLASQRRMSRPAGLSRAARGTSRSIRHPRSHRRPPLARRGEVFGHRGERARSLLRCVGKGVEVSRCGESCASKVAISLREMSRRLPPKQYHIEARRPFVCAAAQCSSRGARGLLRFARSPALRGAPITSASATQARSMHPAGL